MSEQYVIAAAAAIEATFGQRWGVWLSDTGWWWATHRQALYAEQLGAGCVPFLHADNPDELAELIREQERLCPPQPGSTQQEVDLP